MFPLFELFCSHPCSDAVLELVAASSSSSSASGKFDCSSTMFIHVSVSFPSSEPSASSDSLELYISLAFVATSMFEFVSENMGFNFLYYAGS